MGAQNSEDFVAWLEANEIVDGSSFEDIGGVVWLEEGVRIKEAFCNLVSKTFASFEFTQVELPFFIPPAVYSRQPQHYEGLYHLTYKVTSTNEEQSWYLRTTSETPFTYLFRRWLPRRGMPLRFFQVINVFRHETASRLKPLLRTREITPFIESYSGLPTYEAASDQVETEVKLYATILESLCIPYLLNRRPRFDTFPEAQYTMAFDVILPSGEVFQIATVHHLGNSFGRAFEVCNTDGSYIWQTSTGISGRAIGCALAIHRDSSGVVLPYSITPRQVRIQCDREVVPEAVEITRTLSGSNLAHLAHIEVTEGGGRESLLDWFGHGGCINISLSSTSVTITNRAGNVDQVQKSNLEKGIERSIDNYSDWLPKRATVIQESHLSKIPMQTAKRQGFRGIIERPHCGEERCMEQIRDQLKTTGQVLGTDASQSTSGKCEFCGGEARTNIRIAMSKVDYH